MNIICDHCNQPITTTDYITFRKKRYHNDCYDAAVEETRLQQKKKAVKAKKNTSEEEKKLLNYIAELFKIQDGVMPIPIMKQIETYVKHQNMTFEDIFYTLYYWHELQGNPVDTDKKSIAIVPYVVDEALKFLRKIRGANTANNHIEDATQVRHITMKPPDCSLEIYTKIEDL